MFALLQTSSLKYVYWISISTTLTHKWDLIKISLISKIFGTETRISQDFFHHDFFPFLGFEDQDTLLQFVVETYNLYSTLREGCKLEFMKTLNESERKVWRRSFPGMLKFSLSLQSRFFYCTLLVWIHF